MNPEPSWNLIADLQQMLAYPFMVTALRARERSSLSSPVSPAG